MNPIATVTTTKFQTKKIEFHKPELFGFLKNALGIRYSKIDGKGQYLKQNSEGIYEIINFHDIKRVFIDFAKTNMENIPINGECTHNELFNAFIEKTPIKNGNFSREFLSDNFNLDTHNLHLIRLKTNIEYKKEYTTSMMLKFLQKEDFVETIDKAGNFAPQKPLFYKRLNNDSFIVINRPNVDDKNNSTSYDLWKVTAKNESEFLKYKLPEQRIKLIRNVFKFEKYKETIHELQIQNYETNKIN